MNIFKLLFTAISKAYEAAFINTARAWDRRNE